MTQRQWRFRSPLGSALALIACLAGIQTAAAETPLTIDSARISISGTSNIHAFTASTTNIRVTRAQLGTLAGTDFWENLSKTGIVATFEVAIPASTLSSPRDGLDKNMHKALQVNQHPDITFRLIRLEPGSGAPGVFHAIGVLRIAGVEREVVLDITTERKDSTLCVQGHVELLMTDYGIKPPTAMLGMLKTDPKVTITFETVLRIPVT